MHDEAARGGTGPAGAGAGGVRAWKGFDRNLDCRGHASEIGVGHAVEGTAAVRRNGFHACLDPLGTWSYCGPVAMDGSPHRFGEAELAGATEPRRGDTDIADQAIVVRTTLPLKDWIEPGTEDQAPSNLTTARMPSTVRAWEPSASMTRVVSSPAT